MTPLQFLQFWKLCCNMMFNALQVFNNYEWTIFFLFVVLYQNGTSLSYSEQCDIQVIGQK